MPYNFNLPENFKQEGFKIKIREKERVEPPHISIIKKNLTWRFGLREGRFLDKHPPSREVPKELIQLIEKNIDLFITEWDKMYPENKVNSGENL